MTLLTLAAGAMQAVGAAAVGAGIRSSDEQAVTTASPVQSADWQALSVSQTSWMLRSTAYAARHRAASWCIRCGGHRMLACCNMS